MGYEQPLMSSVRMFWVVVLIAGMAALSACSAAIPEGAPTGPGKSTPNLALTATPTPTNTPSSAGELGQDYPQGKAAPEFVGIQQWLNSAPLSLKDLRGKVVLVDFWTYSCINCLRTFPYLQDWHRKYSGHGLVIVGVHSPEFSFEKDEGNVRHAIARLGVAWPVALDNDMKTWDAYVNYYWPHKYLIDARGVIRFDHIGEGEYDKTEKQIQTLLAESGRDVGSVPIGGVTGQGTPGETTDELYMGLGFNFGRYFGGDMGPVKDGTYHFTDPGSHLDNQFYLQGAWKPDQEFLRHHRATSGYEDYVALKYTARSVFAVMQPGTKPYQVKVTLDDRPVPEDMRGKDVTATPDGDTMFSVTESRLYSIIQGPAVATHELKLYAMTEDFTLYTFTFGA